MNPQQLRFGGGHTTDLPLLISRGEAKKDDDTFITASNGRYVLCIVVVHIMVSVGL